MRRTPVSLALVAVGCAAVALAAPSSAASAPAKVAFSDPAGDALATQKTYDITDVLVTSTGTTSTKKVGKKTVTTYTPKAILVKLTVAGSFATTAGANYEVDLDVAGCGYANFTYTPGAISEGGLFTECGSPADETGSTSTLYDAPPTVSGKTVTWQLPLSALSKEFKPGVLLSDIRALAAQNDPVFGIIGAGALAAEGNFDNASTSATLRL